MVDNVVVVVGDDWAEFAGNDGVVTISQLRREAKSCGTPIKRDVIAGQGLTDADLVELRALFPGAILQPARASLRQTHKHETKHVLITALQECGPHEYTCELCMDDSKDRLVDHVSGQHLAGMVLVEAGRQATIGALEWEYAADNGHAWGMSLTTLSVQFVGYVFPLPMLLRVQVAEDLARRNRSQRLVTVHIEYSQAGEVVCKQELNVRLLGPRLLSELENKRARRMIKDVRQRVAAGVPAEPVHNDPPGWSASPASALDIGAHGAVASFAGGNGRHAEFGYQDPIASAASAGTGSADEL
jgi:hypothetical protein